MRREGNQIVINGRKWCAFISRFDHKCNLANFFIRFISGASDPRCRFHLVMGKSDPDNSDRYRQQSVVIVPADTPGVKVIRPMLILGYDHAPEGHSEVVYEDVRVPLDNLVYGWGKGFEVSADETLFIHPSSQFV
jgi:acyl-CoA dehydrogenase